MGRPPKIHPSYSDENIRQATRNEKKELPVLLGSREQRRWEAKRDKKKGNIQKKKKGKK